MKAERNPPVSTADGCRRGLVGTGFSLVRAGRDASRVPPHPQAGWLGDPDVERARRARSGDRRFRCGDSHGQRCRGRSRVFVRRGPAKPCGPARFSGGPSRSNSTTSKISTRKGFWVGLSRPRMLPRGRRAGRVGRSLEGGLSSVPAEWNGCAPLPDDNLRGPTKWRVNGRKPGRRCAKSSRSIGDEGSRGLVRTI